MSPYEKREGYPGYDIVAAAPSYSNITGLVAGFALTAVVLAFTVAATATLTHLQQVDLGFATTLFALGFVGCLLCAYSFASIGGERSSVATLTNSMLVGSGLSVCIVAILGGFEALARAFLPGSAAVFFFVCVVAACVAQPMVWLPHWDIIQRFGPSPYPGPPLTKEDAARLLVKLSAVGVTAALASTAVHFSALLGHPKHSEYLVLTVVGLLFTATTILAGFWFSTRMYRVRLSVGWTWALSLVQSLTIFALLALLP